jgi:DUF4097 and DUF4098 domain-containing protein YvlB
MPTKAGAPVRIENVAGSVRVSAIDGNEVVVTGTLGDGSLGLTAEQKGKGIEIRVELPKDGKDVEETHLVVSVPRSSALDIETVSASIQVVNVDGAHELETVSGDVQLMGVDGDFSATSVSGKMEIGDCGGNLKAATTSGTLHLFGSRFDSAKVESLSGEVGFDADLADDGQYDLESFSGRVMVNVSAEDSAAFEIHTFSGAIENDFSGPVVEEPAGPGKSCEFVLGGGSAKVEITSFSGNVTVGRRAPKG